ncbi:MAG: Flp family type IVb pilin [Micromonosporaceae bacterium]
MRRRDPDQAASSVEYALLASLIAVVIAGTVATLGTQVLALFDSVVFP